MRAIWVSAGLASRELVKPVKDANDDVVRCVVAEGKCLTDDLHRLESVAGVDSLSFHACDHLVDVVVIGLGPDWLLLLPILID